jgi:DNA mismatch repair protein MutS2
MVNTVSILEHADHESLVLFDELGAGTDPTEGAALATAILSNLHRRGAMVMATTHYSELKLYALQTDDVQNASCEFDVASLQPTYRLLIGVPGKSNAFAIASKLGLSQEIIADARERITSDTQHFEDVLADLETARMRLEQEQQTISQSRKEISRLKKELREKNEKLDQSKERILQNANQEAGQILAEAKAVADDTIRKYTKWAKSDKNIRQMEQERANLRNQINKHQSQVGIKTETRKKSKISPKDLVIGADVHIISLNAKGTVSTLPNDKGDLLVQAGLLRTRVNIRDLELLPPEKSSDISRTKTGGGQIGMNKASTVHQDINLIGMTVDEAMPVLTKYLDDAYLAHLSQVTVIHGRGTGALRKAVHQQLSRLKYVKSYRLGEFGEGDAGVTIVIFK